MDDADSGCTFSWAALLSDSLLVVSLFGRSTLLVQHSEPSLIATYSSFLPSPFLYADLGMQFSTLLFLHSLHLSILQSVSPLRQRPGKQFSSLHVVSTLFFSFFHTSTFVIILILEFHIQLYRIWTFMTSLFVMHGLSSISDLCWTMSRMWSFATKSFVWMQRTVSSDFQWKEIGWRDGEVQL